MVPTLIITLKIIAVLIPLILVIGLFKPGWILFWMKHPDRMTLSCLCLLAFMATWTGIAKLTLAPKPPVAETHDEKENDQRNALQLDSR